MNVEWPNSCLASMAHTSLSTFTASMVTLDNPNAPNLFPTFHTAHVKPSQDNDDLKYPSRSLTKPGPILVDNLPEYTIDHILDHKKLQGDNITYLVRWAGYG